MVESAFRPSFELLLVVFGLDSLKVAIFSLVTILTNIVFTATISLAASLHR